MQNAIPIQVNYHLPLAEMSSKQIAKVIGVVGRYFGVNAENYFGLPYTSSSAFAGLWNTNVEETVYGDRSVQGFTLSADNRVIMLTHTPDETEYWFVIGKLRN